MLKLQQSVQYTLNTSADYPDATITVYIALTGYDAESFQLDVNTLTVPIVKQEYRKPKILEVRILQVTRSSATFQVFGDIKGFLYFGYGD